MAEETMDIDRRTFLSTIGAAAAAHGLPTASTGTPDRRKSDYTLAAYYFGNYHVDQRNEAAHGKDWTEWHILQAAKPRFAGHQQPKVPLWGYEDESSPNVFEKKIDAAANAGINAFIFDWYWYEGEIFLRGALEKGYLHSTNRAELKFAIMWANHDWYDIHPAKLSGHPFLQYPGSVTRAEFDRLTTYLVREYFNQPTYWQIDGCPYFSIYELYRFVLGMGGVKGASLALESFRNKVKAAGFKDLHLNAISWGVQLLPGQSDVPDVKQLLASLNVDSTTSYVWTHHAEMRKFPVIPYEEVRSTYEVYRDSASENLSKPYFPNVTVGWDSSPRACGTDVFTKGDYPFLPVIQGNSPEAFEGALRSAKNFLDRRLSHHEKVLTINSWNEWTEGSYLEPDELHKMAYLDAVRNVFKI